MSVWGAHSGGEEWGETVRFWIEFESLWILSDFFFSAFLGEGHANIFLTLNYMGKKLWVSGPFWALCNLINPFSGMLVSRAAEVPRSFRESQGTIVTSTSILPLLQGQGDRLWVLQVQRQAPQVIYLQTP